MSAKTGRLEFREIDVERDRDVCIKFRADSFAASFGSEDGFFAEAGPECQSYLDDLREKNRDLRGSCAHAWLDGRIVGQVEIRRDRDDGRYARVLLYYLAPDVRGNGLGDELDGYVLALLRREGFVGARLRVSPTNTRAIAYYRKHGWIDCGPDPQRSNVNVMKRAVSGVKS
jgi:ribosomal protein S18 acetylase RimI-like enzyme